MISSYKIFIRMKKRLSVKYPIVNNSVLKLLNLSLGPCVRVDDTISGLK